MTYIVIGIIILLAVPAWMIHRLRLFPRNTDSWNGELFEDLPLLIIQLNDKWEIVRQNRVATGLLESTCHGSYILDVLPNLPADTLAEMLIGKTDSCEAPVKGIEYSFSLISRDTRDTLILAGIPAGKNPAIRRQLLDKISTLTAITEATQDAIIMIDNFGRITFWNPAAELMFGYRRDEALQKDVHTLLAPSKQYKKCVRGLQSFRETCSGPAVGRVNQLSAVRKNGREFDIELSLSPVKIGENWHAIGVVRDVTETVRARDQIRESQREYRQLVNAVMEGIGIVDENEVITFCNPAFAAIFDVEATDSLIGRNVREFIVPGHHEYIQNQTENRKQGIQSRYELDIISNKGVHKSLLLSASPRFVDGKYAGAFGLLLDITDRKRTEAQLKQSEQKFYDVFHKSAQAHFLVDEGRIVDFNRAALRLLKYNDTDSLLNMAVSDLSPQYQTDGSVSDELIAEKSKGALSTGRAHFEWIAVCKDHSQIPVDVNLVSIPLEGKQTIYATVENLSEERRSQIIQRALLQISEIKDDSDDLSAHYAMTCSELTKLLPVDSFYVALIDDTSIGFHITFHSRGVPGTDVLASYAIRQVLDLVRTQRKPVLVNGKTLREFQEAGRIISDAAIEPVWLGVPVIGAGDVLGILVVSRNTPDATYTDMDIELLQIFSDHLGVVVQRKQAQLQLKHNEERLKVILEYVKVGIQLVEPETGRITYVNNLIEELIGIPKKQIIGARSGQFFSHVQSASIDIRQKKAFKDWLVEYVRADGFKISALKTRIPVYFDDREYFLESIVDITNYCMAQERLRMTLNELEAIFESSPVGIVVLVEGKIVKVNQRLADMLGYDTDALIGQSPRKFHVSKEHFLEFRKLYYASLSQNDFVQIEFPLKMKNGEEIWFQSNGKAIDSQDPSKGSIWILDDISERRRFQDELRRAKDKAESANNAKSQFLANMSHEIRTPLNGIIGMTELALSTSLTDEQREFLDLIKVSGEGLLHVINDILDFSKIEAGHLQLEEIPFNLHETIEIAVEPLAIQARQKQLSFHTMLDPKLPKMAIGDPNRLKQVIINLAGNAVKFTDTGQVEMQVYLKSMYPDLRLNFKISDTGIGIPLEMQNNIFASFTQADGTTTRKYGGTGLGTTISREIVEHMGGEIWLESPTNITGDGGPGTTFHFTVTMRPFTENDKTADKSAFEPVLFEEKSDGTVDRERILLAEDNPVNRKLAKTLIENSGYIVDAVSDGIQAVKNWQKNKYDLILMDVQMPGLDGIEATERIRGEEKDNDTECPIPIIALTAGISSVDLDRIKQAGMNDVLGKPLFPKTLHACLDKYIAPPRSVSPDLSGSQR